MQAYRVLTTPAAERDFREALEYIARDSRESAEVWADRIWDAISSLETFPERAPVIPEGAAPGGEYRHLVQGHYRLVFRIEGRKVILLRILHAARLLEVDELEPGE